MSLNEWPVPSARMRPVLATRACSSPTVAGRLRPAARNTTLPAQFLRDPSSMLALPTVSVACPRIPRAFPLLPPDPPADPPVPAASLPVICPVISDQASLEGPTMRIASRVAVATVASGALVAGAFALMSSAHASSTGRAGAGTSASRPVTYSFQTLDDNSDLTFNQLLGINSGGVIAGYFGSGAQGHPNMGYLLGQRSYPNENFPGSAQTQVTGLNDNGVTVGFWSGMNNASMSNDNSGFYAINGSDYHSVNFPADSPASPPVDQLLGVNDRDVAVGFYTDAKGNNHGYEYSISGNSFSRVLDPSDTGASLTAADINNHGDMAGFYTDAAGQTDGFLKAAGGQFTSLAYPGASATSAFGVNDDDEVVGTYTDGTGNSATTHGFTWTPGGGFSAVDDPHGIGATTINGVNDRGDLVG